MGIHLQENFWETVLIMQACAQKKMVKYLFNILKIFIQNG